jgi:hypothetical protein
MNPGHDNPPWRDDALIAACAAKQDAEERLRGMQWMYAFTLVSLSAIVVFSVMLKII